MSELLLNGIFLKKLFQWPYCKRRCPYCNYNKYICKEVDEERMKKCLIQELETLVHKSCVENITTLFFGGGTPSLASPNTINSVIEKAKSVGNLTSSAEITIEVNPTEIEAKKLKEFKDAGINRMSIGLQSLNLRDLIFLGRDHSVEDGLRCLSEARSLLPGQVSVDIMFGRPNQTMAQWVEELEQLLSVCDNHISLYQLTVERGTELYKQVKSDKVLLPSNNEMANLYKCAVKLLEGRGFEHYEVSNYAKDACYSHHNLTYWTGGDYIGIGPGAHGRLTVKDNGKYIREARTQTLEPYNWMYAVEKYGHGTTRSVKQGIYDRCVETLSSSLRTKWGISHPNWRKVNPIGLSKLFGSSDTINLLQSSDLLILDKRGLRATEKGLIVLDSLLVELVSVLHESLNK
ncbi:hypothetical protein LOTGIDRAFT_131730 [Lottia gigantea]|uniref:Radical S-adenosyl methionine domain-containing protein 1, mitochondrial n=1 Tax=Lottia gigantea TaxID=225164 RepID=V3Z2C4_LOTGI|nr:hypothetical protein LOTGIDRAFT_131730 [Lottia gigantea]ESO84748.1 hypothetical protein LOTGIDRAFT_131730 [Lottia gigantea]